MIVGCVNNFKSYLDRVDKSTIFGMQGTPRFPNGSRRGSTIEVCRAELSDLGDGSGDRRDPGTMHQEGSPGTQAGGVRAGPVLKSDGGKARGPDGGNQGRSRAAQNSGRHTGNRAGDERQTWNATCATKKAISRENAQPTLRNDAWETDIGVGHGGKWAIPPWTDRGERG